MSEQQDVQRFYRLYRDPAARQKGLRLALMGQQPNLGLSWRMGRRFEAAPPEPIRCTLDRRSGPDLPDAFLADRIPLFSDRLVEILRAAGVDNLDCYAAEVLSPDGEKVGKPYQAANIIGKVMAADESASSHDQRSEFPMLEFERIRIDPAAVQDLLLFRLAENPSFIIVAEPVKQALEAADLVNVRAVSLDDPAAY